MSVKTKQSEIKNVPELRFPDFDGVWLEKRLEKILKIGSGKDHKNLKEGDVPVFGTGGYMRSVDQILHSGKTVFIGRKGTIDKPFFYEGDFWTVDTLFYTHDFCNVTPEFVYLIFQNINWQKYNEASGVPSLSKETIKKIKANLPTLPEQQKIASFLTSVDNWINNLKTQKENLESYKKGMMQKIFSQEVRFKNDNGKDFPEWEEERLSNFLTERNQKAPKSNSYPLMAFVKDVGVTPKGERYNREFLVNDNDNKKYKRTEYGDFIYSSNNLETGSIGLNHYGAATISPVYSIFNIEKSCDHRFIGMLLLRKRFLNEMLRYRQGVVYGQWRIRESDFLRIKVKIPKLPEQQKVAEFLTSLDNLIESKQKQITKAEEWKNGLMQKMFV